MAKYLITASYSAVGLKGLQKDKASGRQDAVRQACESMGGRLEAFYLAFGEDDVVTIVDLPETLLSRPKAINQVGQILVEGTKVSSGLNHAYVLTPTSGPGGLQMNLTPTVGQWRIDGGAWQTSGSPVLNLAIGSHIIEYSEVAGYTHPPTETVTISSGRLLQLNRSYTSM